MSKTRTRRNPSRKIYWTGIFTVVGAVIVWFTTVGSNLTSIASNVLKTRQAPTAIASSQPTGKNPAPLEKPRAARQAPSSLSTFQRSTGNQSPNLKNVHGSLRLQYQSAPAPGVSPTQGPAQLPVLDVPAKTAGSVQISTGVQSPNISGVDRDVEITYTTPGDSTIKN